MAGMAGDNDQCVVLYPKDMPPPEGMPDRPNKKASWISRRNSTWSAIDDSPGRASGGTRRVPRSPTPSTDKGPAGFRRIICAINTFGQGGLFRVTPAHNGYCVRNDRTPSAGAGSRCP